MKMIKKLPLSLVFGTLALFLAQNAPAADAVKTIHVDHKKIKSAFPSEFKQAVAYYIKRTDSFPALGENSAYKKELRYLLKNYGKFSVTTLLSRVRSAHQTMILQETDSENDVYQRYEKTCSALLLVCAQVLFNETRSHILQALHEIDNLLNYWRYQRNHPLHYFFSKSPIKWVMGKEQVKEVSYNIARLERKQKELYTLLGSLIGHAHEFTTLDGTYQTCYVWIEQLLQIIKCSSTISNNPINESSFDECASQLEDKLRHIKNFKSECLSSLVGAKKSNHFVRNWARYTLLCAAAAYMIHYGSKNPEVMSSAFNVVQDEASKFVILLLHPLQKIYDRGKLVFSDEKVEEPKKQQDSVSNELPIDREKQLLELTQKLVEVGGKIPCDHAAIIERSNADFRKGGLDDLREVVSMLADPKDGWIWSSSYRFDQRKIIESINKIEKIVVPMKIENTITNKKELDEYKEAFGIVKDFIAQFKKEAAWTAEGLYIKTNLSKAEFVLTVDEDYLNTLLGYLEIIEKRIIPIFEYIVAIAENLIVQVSGLIDQANNLEIAFAQQLKDHELTLMFTSLIPLGIITFGATKFYQWSISRDYSPIRIALAEVNSLLIEADNYADDHYYGKLIYLICKLRHKSEKLKDPMANEFLDEVTKLESKQYSAQTKHAIVENMFNKYAFLGKITA